MRNLYHYYCYITYYSVTMNEFKIQRLSITRCRHTTEHKSSLKIKASKINNNKDNNNNNK